MNTPEPLLTSTGPPAPKFCPTCGAAWQPDWATCQACSVRAPACESPPGDAPSMSITSALALYFAFLLVALICTALLRFSDEDDSSRQAAVEIAGSVISAVLVLAWCVFGTERSRLGLRSPASSVWYAGAAVMAVGTYLIASLATGALKSLVQIDEVQYAAPFLESGYGWWTVILVICVEPAIVEELAFRGVIFSGLLRILTSREVVIVSALMFMVIHFAVPSFPHLLIIGLALGWLRWRTQSLYPGMLLHFTHNLLVVLDEGLGGATP